MQSRIYVLMILCMATSTKLLKAGFGIIFHMELLGEEKGGKFMMLTTQLARAFKIFSAKTLAAGGLLWLHLT